MSSMSKVERIQITIVVVKKYNMILFEVFFFLSSSEPTNYFTVVFDQQRSLTKGRLVKNFIFYNLGNLSFITRLYCSTVEIKIVFSLFFAILQF